MSTPSTLQRLTTAVGRSYRVEREPGAAGIAPHGDPPFPRPARRMNQSAFASYTRRIDDPLRWKCLSRDGDGRLYLVRHGIVADSVGGALEVLASDLRLRRL